MSSLFKKLFSKNNDRLSLKNNFDAEFFIGKVLGQGGFAVVHQVTRKSDSKKFAVKIIDKSKIKGKNVFI
jgi:serine/threonine protein kinase